MGLLEYIERLRHEPETKRRQVTFWTTAGLTLLIVIVWFSTLRYTTFPGNNSVATAPAVSQSASSSPSVFDKIKLGWQTIIH